MKCTRYETAVYLVSMVKHRGNKAVSEDSDMMETGSVETPNRACAHEEDMARSVVRISLEL